MWNFLLNRSGYLFLIALVTLTAIADDKPPAAPSTCATRLLLKDSSDAGSFIHRIWQLGNSYRTRYKPMKAEDGSPITDITKYIAERQIPAMYHGYYRQNTKGTWEEDLKQIPNEYLAANNGKENEVGATDYLVQLEQMERSPAATLEDAKVKILSALRAIHLSWWERNNATWEATTFDAAGIEARYNGTWQFYKLAEVQGLFTHKPWKEGFDSFLGELATEKFEPYIHMTASAAYLNMTHKTGSRPAITGDPHVTAFFDSRFPPIDFKFPADRKNEAGVVMDFLKKVDRALLLFNVEDCEITSPPVSPGSSARVYLIRNKKSTELMAVLKLQEGLIGLQETVAVLAAEEALPASPIMKPVQTLAAGKVGENDYFIIQKGAITHEAERSFKNRSELEDTVKKVAVALVELHGAARTFSESELKDMGTDLATLHGNLFYDIREMNAYCYGDQEKNIDESTDSSLSDADLAELVSRLQYQSKTYSRIAELEPHTLSPTIIHGDAHGGNIFLNDKGTQIIDYGGSTFFLGKRIGTGDRGNDVGRFLGNILVEATRYSVPQEEIISLIDLFVSTYAETVGIEENSPQGKSLKTSVLFYMNRFVAINVMDKEGKKFKPVNGESQQELKAALYRNWLAVLRHRGTVPQSVLALRVLISTDAKMQTFVKVPILGYRLDAKLDKLPDAIVSILGRRDQKEYSASWRAENIGSFVALQWSDQGADFYIVGASTAREKYIEVPLSEVQAENPGLWQNIIGTEGMKPLIENDPRVTAFRKPEPVEMYRLSDLGFPVEQELIFEDPSGNPTKIAGDDPYIAKNPEGRWYLINPDNNGLPIAYSPHVPKK